MPSSGSIAGCVQTGPPPYFQESPSQVSWPNSPGPGSVQNFQTSLPVFASYAPNCPRTPLFAAADADVDQAVVVDGGRARRASRGSASCVFQTRRRSSDRARSGALSRRPEKTLPSATATPRFVPPSVVSMLPLHRARCGVDREDVSRARRDEHHAVDDDRRGLHGAGRLSVLEMNRPRAAEFREIRLVDFGERGKPVIREVSTHQREVPGGWSLRIISEGRKGRRETALPRRAAEEVLRQPGVVCRDRHQARMLPRRIPIPQDLQKPAGLCRSPIAKAAADVI